MKITAADRFKVCQIGNRLSRSMDHNAAFIEAWRIVKAGGLELAVKDVSFGNRQEALRRLAGYDPAGVRTLLVPEPENPVDPAVVAVMVMVQGGRASTAWGMCPRP